MRPQSDVSEATAHALHLMAWASAGSPLRPGYAREDERLRRSAGYRKRPDPDTVPCADVRAALELAAAPSEDAAWFQRRWREGEAEAMAARAAEHATEVAAVPDGGLPPDAEGWHLRVSAAMGPEAVASTEARVVVGGPKTPPLVYLLAVVGAWLGPNLVPEGLDADTRRLLELHAAGGALTRALGGVEPLEPWLPGVVEALLPLPGKERPFRRCVWRAADAAVDQPPGEVKRIADGLGARRLTRLQRAWRRGFFLTEAAAAMVDRAREGEHEGGADDSGRDPDPR